MRLPALLAVAALVGLGACDSAKMSELTGAKPAQTVAIGGRPAVTAAPPATACPPTPAPACPPAQPAMAPETSKAAPKAAPAAVAPAKTWARKRHIAWRATPRHVRRVMAARHHRQAAPPVRRYAYARTYEASPPMPYARVPQGGGYVERHYERRYEGPPPAYAHEGYRYEHREDRYSGGHAPYADERQDDRQAYGYERRESESDSYRHQRRESGYSSGGYARPDDCGCQPQAAGRDRLGFLTWPGKQP